MRVGVFAQQPRADRVERAGIGGRGARRGLGGELAPQQALRRAG